MRLFNIKKILLNLFMNLLFVGVMANPIVVMETSEGIIEIKLKPEIAPKACENMIKLLKTAIMMGWSFTVSSQLL